MRKKTTEYTRKRVDLNFRSSEDRVKFEEFLKKTGRKAGPYLMALIAQDQEPKK